MIIKVDGYEFLVKFREVSSSLAYGPHYEVVTESTPDTLKRVLDAYKTDPTAHIPWSGAYDKIPYRVYSLPTGADIDQWDTIA